MSWTNVDIFGVGSGGAGIDVTWSPELGIFVAGGFTADYSDTIATSPDGINWTLRGNPFLSGGYGYPFEVIWASGIDGGLFIAVGVSGDYSISIATSPDGEVWTTYGNPWDQSQNGQGYSVAYSPSLNLLVAGGYSNDASVNIVTSPDGATWTPRTSSFDGTGSGVNGACWSDDLEMFLVVGSGDFDVETSPNGTDWTSQIAFGDGFGFGNKVTWFSPAQLFVATGFADIDGIDKYIFTSADGTSWNYYSSGFISGDGGFTNGVDHSDNRLLIFGESNSGGKSIVTSEDGARFREDGTSIMNGQALAGAWSPELDLWVVVGQGDTSAMYGNPPLPIEGPFITEWIMKNYDLNGTPVEADYDGYSDKGVTNRIWHATNRNLTFILNGVDEGDFTLYLDDPMAAQIRALYNVVKIWRRIVDSNGTVVYEDPDEFPTFAGVVGYTIKNGDSNTVQFKLYNPMWRLQFRFHILNHYLVDYKQSELMWKLIDLINNAFGVASFTGISEGSFSWSGEPTVSPYFVGKGSNTWSHIFDDIMNRVAGSDLWPSYFHFDDDAAFMTFNTVEKRGRDLRSTTSFNYHTETESNCDDLSEEVNAVAGEFANFVWAVGQGGPNSGKVAMAEDNTAVDYGYNAVGVYMKKEDRSEIKRITALQPIADSELAQSKIPKFAYTVTLSPAASLFYGDNMDFAIGDVVKLNANRGALLVENKDQRIYQCQLGISDNNVETASPLLANDFYGKFVDA